MIEFKRIYEDEEYDVLVPENFQTSQWMGGDWCTSKNEKNFRTLNEMGCILFRIFKNGIPILRLTWSKRIWSYAQPNSPAIFSDSSNPFDKSVLNPTYKYMQHYLDSHAKPIYDIIKNLPKELQLAIINHKYEYHGSI